MAVALWRAVAVVNTGALVVARASTNPRGEMLPRGKGRCDRAHFGNDLLRRVHSQTGHFRQPLDGVLMLAQYPVDLSYERVGGTTL